VKLQLPGIGLMLAVGVMGNAMLSQAQKAPPLRFEVAGDRAYAFGYTDGRSVSAVDQLLRAYPDINTLVLSQVSGTQDVVSNDALARRIRKAGLNTHLEANSSIASGAVDLFISGVQRTAECGARVGVHAWGGAGFDAQDAKEGLGWDNMAAFKRDFLEDMGIAPNFYDYTRQAAPSAGIL